MGSFDLEAALEKIAVSDAWVRRGIASAFEKGKVSPQRAYQTLEKFKGRLPKLDAMRKSKRMSVSAYSGAAPAKSLQPLWREEYNKAVAGHTRVVGQAERRISGMNELASQLSERGQWPAAIPPEVAAKHIGRDTSPIIAEVLLEKSPTLRKHIGGTVESEVGGALRSAGAPIRGGTPVPPVLNEGQMNRELDGSPWAARIAGGIATAMGVGGYKYYKHRSEKKEQGKKEAMELLGVTL